MNALESQLDYPLGDALPEAGKTIEIAPGVRWARMTLPFALDHINVWLLRDVERENAGADPTQRGWTIVDCGIDDAGTRANWESIFAHELGGLPVLRVIVTHMHPDHLGLAHWLCARWKARLWISATDYNVAKLVSAVSSGFGGPKSAAFMAEHGLVDPAALEEVSLRTNYYTGLVPALPDAYRRLLDRGTVTIDDHAWTCHAGYGHAPEHMALHCEAQGVLISGDMVLPRISTNVSVIEVEPEGDPLTLYLDSIERMRAIDAGVLVLPSHGRPFRGLHTRIDQLQSHHADRFADVLHACAEAPQSAFDLVPVLFKRKLDLHQMTFAMGESIAHCHALWLKGKLSRVKGGDGVMRFALPS